MPAFYTLDTLYKMQHVAQNNLHIWAVLLLFLGVLCVNGSHHILHIFALIYNFEPSGRNIDS